MKPIEIFRTETEIRTITDNYDLSQYEAPIVVSHPMSDNPVVEWVEDVFAKGDSLFAILKQIECGLGGMSRERGHRCYF